MLIFYWFLWLFGVKHYTVSLKHRGFMRIANVLCFLYLIFFLYGCSSPEPVTLHPVWEEQSMRYPEMETQDWYKLLHQAAMGNRHLGVEDSLIYNYMLDELSRITASGSEPLIEYISPDSELVRFNLRPFKAAGGDPDVLFQAMQSTWDTVIPSEELLGEYWRDLVAVAQHGQIGGSAEEVDQFFKAKQEEGFPAVHHSERYNTQYQPAYRVLLHEFIPE